MADPHLTFCSPLARNILISNHQPPTTRRTMAHPNVCPQTLVRTPKGKAPRIHWIPSEQVTRRPAKHFPPRKNQARASPDVVQSDLVLPPGKPGVLFSGIQRCSWGVSPCQVLRCLRAGVHQRHDLGLTKRRSVQFVVVRGWTGHRCLSRHSSPAIAPGSCWRGLPSESVQFLEVRKDQATVQWQPPPPHFLLPLGAGGHCLSDTLPPGGGGGQRVGGSKTFFSGFWEARTSPGGGGGGWGWDFLGCCICEPWDSWALKSLA